MKGEYSLEFTHWGWFACLLVARYLIFAGVPYYLCYVLKQVQWKSNKIKKKRPSVSTVSKEIGYSLGTLLLYSLGIWLFKYLIDSGRTGHYLEIEDMGIIYFIISTIFMIFLHDTYFYWLHRLLHNKAFFKYVHLVHHKFHNPTPFAAFAFHPLESLLSMGIVPIIMIIMPWHPIALMVFVTFMTAYDVFIHLGFNFKGLRILKWQNTPVEHDWHHTHSHGNYGLYFTFWDRLMGTYMKTNSNSTLSEKCI